MSRPGRIYGQLLHCMQSVSDALGRSGDLSGMPIVLRCLFGDSSHARRAAMAYGAIVGQKFRPNAAGIAEARRYYKARKNVLDG